MPTPRQIEKIKNRLLLLNGKPDLGFLTELETITDELDKLKGLDMGKAQEMAGLFQRMEEKIQVLLAQIRDKETEVAGQVSDFLSEAKSLLEDSRRQSAQETKARVDMALEKFKNIPIPQDGEDGVDGKDANPEDVVPLVLEKIKLPEYEKFILEGKGEEVVKEINSLPTNDETYKIDASHIKNLPKSNKGNIVFAPPKGSLQVKDLSASLNGTDKTFALPGFEKIVMITSTSFPYTFRPTVDFTVNYATFEITFTSEIDAGSTLQAGQTLLVIYTT